MTGWRIRADIQGGIESKFLNDTTLWFGQTVGKGDFYQGLSWGGKVVIKQPRVKKSVGWSEDPALAKLYASDKTARRSFEDGSCSNHWSRAYPGFLMHTTYTLERVRDGEVVETKPLLDGTGGSSD